MLTRLETAATWVQAVALGLVFGALWILGEKLVLSHGWGEALSSGAFAAALYSIVVGPVAAKKQRRDQTEAGLDTLPLHQQRAALRATRGGPEPTDPAVRHAALRQRAPVQNRNAAIAISGGDEAAAEA